MFFLISNILLHAVAVVSLSRMLFLPLDRFICRVRSHIQSSRPPNGIMSVCSTSTVLCCAVVVSFQWFLLPLLRRTYVYEWAMCSCSCMCVCAWVRLDGIRLCMPNSNVHTFVCSLVHSFVRSLSFIMPFECVCNVLFELVKNIKNVVLLLTNNTLNQLLIALRSAQPHTHMMCYIRNVRAYAQTYILSSWQANSVISTLTRFIFTLLFILCVSKTKFIHMKKERRKSNRMVWREANEMVEFWHLYEPIWTGTVCVMNECMRTSPVISRAFTFFPFDFEFFFYFFKFRLRFLPMSA